MCQRLNNCLTRVFRCRKSICKKVILEAYVLGIFFQQLSAHFLQIFSAFCHINCRTQHFLAYEVAIGFSNWVAASGVRAHNFTSLSASTCYGLNVRAKVDCDNTATFAPNQPQYSDTLAISQCTKPSPCVISAVSDS